MFGSDLMRIARRECHAHNEWPNNDMCVSKVNDLFDEIVCEAFAINSKGCLVKIPLNSMKIFFFSFYGTMQALQHGHCQNQLRRKTLICRLLTTRAAVTSKQSGMHEVVIMHTIH